MKRTQIYIDDKTFEYLKKESKLENKTISELIRDSIREKMNHNTKNIIKNLQGIFGIWKNRKFDTNEYVRKLRKDRDIW